MSYESPKVTLYYSTELNALAALSTTNSEVLSICFGVQAYEGWKSPVHVDRWEASTYKITPHEQRRKEERFLLIKLSNCNTKLKWALFLLSLQKLFFFLLHTDSCVILFGANLTADRLMWWIIKKMNVVHSQKNHIRTHEKVSWIPHLLKSTN